jgi:hypothetical protein
MHSKLNSMLSDSFVEAMWETGIALATAAGICVSVISLAAHLTSCAFSRRAASLQRARRRPVSPASMARRQPQTSIEFNLHGGSRIASSAAPQRGI